MTKTRDSNPITSGAIGAAAGAVIGGATTVLLTNKSTRRKIVSKLMDIKDYAEDAAKTVNDVAAKQQMGRLRLAGVKGGRTKKRGISSKS